MSQSPSATGHPVPARWFLVPGWYSISHSLTTGIVIRHMRIVSHIFEASGTALPGGLIQRLRNSALRFYLKIRFL